MLKPYYTEQQEVNIQVLGRKLNSKTPYYSLAIYL